MKALIVSQFEVTHNPRLLKAADLFLSHSFEVDVLTGVSGIAPYNLYQKMVNSRTWKVYEIKYDKRTLRAKINWLYKSLLQRVQVILWRKSGYSFFYGNMLNKGLIGATIPKKKYDIILINLVDSLPFAVHYKKRTNSSFLIYDSQEFFQGQFAKYEAYKYEWVKRAERKYASDVDIVLGTTTAMCKRLKDLFNDKPIFRVRNAPIAPISFNEVPESSVLKLVWHGMSINYNNCRGLHIIVHAIGMCKTDVTLFLQGKRVEPDHSEILKDAKNMGIEDKIVFLDSAPPDEIIASIHKYDIGITGELPEEENQLLTSSNKLFEYIHAGLCTIVPDLPGIVETIDEYHTGEIYESGDAESLSALIDKLNNDRALLRYYKNNSLKSRQFLTFEKDYREILNFIGFQVAK